MQSGSMYSDIWDGLAPLSAIIYQAFTWLFGRSAVMLLILGSVVTFFQAAIINTFSIKAKVFESNTYLPALIYVLFTSTHPSFFTLSPSLIGLTFILLGLGKLISHVEFRAKADIHIILIGLYFGISSLFYLPYIVIIPISIVLLALFSNTLLRRYFLLIFTSLAPIIIAYFYYWIKSDHSAYFISYFINSVVYNRHYVNIGWYFSIIILCYSFFFMILGIVSIGKQRRLNNYQFRIVQLFLVLGVLMMSILLLEKPITHYNLVVFIPFASFFTVHLIALFKRPVLTILLNIVLSVGPIFMLWSISHNWFPEVNTSPDTTSLKRFESIVKNKRIMILGSAKHLYKDASLAGPFYDWGLSKTFIAELDYYDNLVFLQNALTKSEPEVIIDLENNWNKISKRLPMISKKYYLAQPNVWLRRN